MNSTILSSTFLLTLLLSVGLLFFIRASTKDRIQAIKLVSEQPLASLMTQLRQYLQERSYQVAKVDEENNSVTFEGFVKPSVFLAIFLTMLAAVGTLCLALVYSFLFPNSSLAFLVVLLSPAAGVFYWKKSARNEQVSLKLENTSSESQQQSQVTVIGHRDEIAELVRSLNLKPAE